MGISTASSKPQGKKRSMQVNVVVRVRPSLPHEKSQPMALCVTKPTTRGQGHVIRMTSPHATSEEETTAFVFEKCYDDATPQRLLFQREIQPAIAHVLQGVNTTVFAYGATGTGKTFTMEGSKRNLGMIPRALKRLFDVIDQQKAMVVVEMSYLEIYNDRVLDLLVPKAQQTDLPIRQQTDGTIAVQGLVKKRIATLTEFEELYDKGSASRARAATELNPESSRSHSILMIQTRTTHDGEIRCGKLHLIDLAGSEDNRRTGNSGARLTESGKINMSLFVLGKVITALNSGDLQRIPFRDSRLTRLLQDSLGGSSHAVMICTVAQGAGLYQECLQTLNYAVKAKGIVNQVTVNTPVAVTKKTVDSKKPVAVASKTVKPTAPVASSRVMKPLTTIKTPSPAPASRVSKPVSNLVKKLIIPRTSTSPSTAAMEKKLFQWKQSKQHGRTSLEKRQSADGSSTTGLKRPLPTSTVPSTRSPVNPPIRALSCEAGAMRVSAPAIKKPRVSVAPSNPLSKMSKPVQRRISNSTDDKENVSINEPTPTPVVAPMNLLKDLSPVDLAKKLIGVAIDLEKAKYFTAAYCVFKRAYHVLPEENPKLVERLKALELECPSAPAAVPSQEMSTAVYMQLVLEMNLLEVLNHGTQDELTHLHSIGDKRAEKIMESRPFTQLSDLLNVLGITEKVVHKLHEQYIQWC